MPKAGVIVPVYKVEAYLDRCVQSILDQTYTDYELILVDDGSPDNCGAMCDAWAEKDKRIRVIHKENGGLSDARNVGFEASTAEWITFVDSDDYIHPKMLEALYDATQTYGVKVAVCGFARTEGERLSGESSLLAKVWSPELFYLQRCINATVAWGKLYHKSVVLPYPKGKLHEDEFVTYRILLAQERVAVLDAPLYAYFINDSSITMARWNPRRMDGIEAFEAQRTFFREHGLKELYHQRTRWYVQSLTEHIWQIDISENRWQLLPIRRRLMKKARGCIRQHRKSGIFSFKEDRWFLRTVYPQYYKLYDKFVRIAVRVQRRKGNAQD